MCKKYRLKKQKGGTKEMDRKESQQDERIAAEDVILLYKGLLYYVIRPIVANENLLDDCYSEICQIIISNYEKYDEKKAV